MTPQTREEGGPLYPHADEFLGVVTSKGNSHPFDGSEADWTAFKEVCAQRQQAVNERCALLEQLEACKGALPYPGLTAGTADALAFEIEQGDAAKHKTTPAAKAAWLRNVAHGLKQLEKVLHAPPPARPATQPMKPDQSASSIHTPPYRGHLSIWRRLMCRLSLCGGHVDHAKDQHGIWWVGLRCATCGSLLCPLKSKHQDSPTK